jgi:hypothetical protein
MWGKHGLGIFPYMYALLTLEWHFRNVIWRAIAQPEFLYKERVFCVERRTFKENFTELRIG